ncbi:MAG TPA: sugar ABC transporter permease [Ktedonobacteraceae bacterium]|nr:sugar ABC transporter permease [Ktedonobacteraceae bacterium]
MAELAIPRARTRHTASASRLMRRRQRAGVFFVLPSVLFVSCFFLLPLALTAWMSFNNWTIFGEVHFVGFQNYLALTKDQVFLGSLVFTTEYTVIVCPLITLLGFILALLVQRPLRGVGFFRTAYFLPVVIGLGTASFLWFWLYNDQVGAIDGVLDYFHLIRTPIAWFNDVKTGLTAVVIMIVWKASGLAMLLFLVGIQAIPAELYEAARVDGAGFWTQLFSITLPLLRRTFALILVLIVTGSYLAFDHFYIMTHGGPANQTFTTVMRIVEAGFTNFELGYAGALSIMLLIILLIINGVQLFIMRSSPED